METGGECCGESACCSYCCQEDRGWLYLLLKDVLLVFLLCFAKVADTDVCGTAEAAKDVLLLPTALKGFAHSQSSLGCSGLDIEILSRVCLILAMYKCSFHIPPWKVFTELRFVCLFELGFHFFSEVSFSL